MPRKYPEVDAKFHIASPIKLVMRMAEEQSNRCALTGIPFFTPTGAKSRIPPFVPSIDRITPSLGYVEGKDSGISFYYRRARERILFLSMRPSHNATRIGQNVRLICFAMNAMMLDWGEEIFIQVSDAHRRVRNRTKALGADGNRNTLSNQDLMVRSRRLE
jgi:hypothetical protein